MNARTPNADSAHRRKLEATSHPAYLTLRRQLAKVRKERTRWRLEAARQRARAELWRARALAKGRPR